MNDQLNETLLGWVKAFNDPTLGFSGGISWSQSVFCIRS